MAAYIIGVVMKSRSLVVQIHLILAGIFLPFMLIMPLSGTMELLDIGMEQEKEATFVVEGVVPSEKSEMESFFREQFKKNNIDFDFEYIRTSSTDFIFRPTSRVFYMATPVDGVLTMQKVTPGIFKRMMELHKGHGPQFLRKFQIAFGVSLILVALSGLWIAFVTPMYRRKMLIALSVGLAVIVFALF